MKRAIAAVAIAACSSSTSEPVPRVEHVPPPPAPTCTFPTVLAAGASPSPATVQDLVAAPNGSLSILLAQPSGASISVWSGASWSMRALANSKSLLPAHGSVGDLLCASSDDGTPEADLLRCWTRSTPTIDGFVVPGIDMPSVATGGLTGPSGDDVFLAQHDPGRTTVFVSHETMGGGNPPFVSLGRTTLASAPPGGEIFAVGTGIISNTAMSGETKVVAAAGTSGLALYVLQPTFGSNLRLQQLVSGNVTRAFVSLRPAFDFTSSEPSKTGVALFRDPVSAHLHGLFVLPDGAPTEETDLLAEDVDFVAEVARKPGTVGGKVLISERTGGRSWIVSFDGARFGALEQLRPDLAFEANPHLLWTCGDYFVLHVARQPTAPAGSAPLVLEPLSTFWPGH